MKKIYYCVSQIKMTKILLEKINSDFFSRVLSRQIIIRLYDFITLTRQYNNAFITDYNLKIILKNKLNSLSYEFEDKLKIQRHKFSAHFQDLEFINRADAWSRITKTKIDNFYINVLEIYNLLKHECAFQDILTENLKLSSNDIRGIKKLVNNKNIEKEPHFSNDILSITRTNAVSIIPCHPIQDKVLSLNSIHLMIDFEVSLYYVLQTKVYKELIFIILITDIVNFIDNLITREGSKYIGLDKIIDKQIRPWMYLKYQTNKLSNFILLKQTKYDYKTDTQLENVQNILNSFLDIYNIESLNEIRIIRNKLCAHIDTKDNLDYLLESVDKIDIDFLLKIYLDFYRLFYTICSSVHYLKPFIIPPTKIHGITSISPQPDKDKMFFKR